MDWMIPEKLKKGVSYARFVATLWISCGFVKLKIAKQPTINVKLQEKILSKRRVVGVNPQQRNRKEK